MSLIPADRNVITGAGPDMADIVPGDPLVPADAHRSDKSALTGAESTVVDSRQDEIMAKVSVDGRPPSHRQRSIGWSLVIVGIPLVIIGGATFAIVKGVSIGAVLGVCVVLVLVLLLGGWPVWAAGLSRGREEHAARDQALAEGARRRGTR